MNKINIIILLTLIFIFIVPISNAVYTTDLTYDVFMEIGVTEYINVTLFNSGIKQNNISNCVQIKYDSGSGNVIKNMSYSNDSSMQFFAGFLESTTEQDLQFNITAYSDTACTTSVAVVDNHFMQFRTAFNVTFKFFKSMINQKNLSEVTTQYCNEFQFIGLRPVNSSASSNPITDLSYLDKMFGWMPFYKKTINKKFDNKLTMWADYTGCEGKVKLYEATNYTILMITDDIKGLTWDDEWHFPQFDQDYYKSEIKNSFKIENKKNVIINVIISAWEISKFRVLMNIFLWVVVLLIWLLGTILASYMGWKAVVGWTLGYFTILKVMGIFLF